MALCGSQNCACAFTSSGSITVTGSGNPGDPYVLSGSVTQAPVVTPYLTSTTWAKPDGLLYIDVEVQAAGGGTGGVALTAANQNAISPGGGGGGYSRKIIAATDLGATEPVVVGAGGGGGAAGNNPGGNGGTSSFGTHCSATGAALAAPEGQPSRRHGTLGPVAQAAPAPAATSTSPGRTASRASPWSPRRCPALREDRRTCQGSSPAVRPAPGSPGSADGATAVERRGPATLRARRPAPERPEGQAS